MADPSGKDRRNGLGCSAVSRSFSAFRASSWFVPALAITVLVTEAARRYWGSAVAAYVMRLVVFLWACAVIITRVTDPLWKGFQALASPEVQRTTKQTNVGEGKWFSFATCEMQGWRDAMEDALVCVPELGGALEGKSLFAVFDGHGGSLASAFAAEHIARHVKERCDGDICHGAALQQALLDVEAGLREKSAALDTKILGRDPFNYMGCTATVALVGQTEVTVVNCGDSRVFKCRQGVCVPLTRDHKPESPRERRRIEAAGGRVVKIGPCHRIDCGLNLSRALGDFEYKDPKLAPEDQKVSPCGDVQSAEIDADDEFLCVACDGLYELMTWQSVCDFIHTRIKRGMPLNSIAEALLDACCSPNMAATGGLGTDNETVIIVKFDHEKRKSR
jgi:protein phosphatase 2C family protein 2/3